MIRLFSSTRAKLRASNTRLKKSGTKRLRKIEKIEKRQRSTFNKLIKCPSCHKRAGSSSFCVTCQIRQGNRNRKKNPFNI